MKVIVLDTETTGIIQPEFIEVAYLGLDDTLEKLQEDEHFFGRSLNPIDLTFKTTFNERFFPSKAIEPGASKINGIYKKDLIGFRKSSEFEMPEGVEFLIGHNITFDKRALNFNPENILVSNSVKMICTKELAQLSITGQKNNKLTTLIEYLYPEYSEELLETAHTALQDCKLTYLVLLKCLEKLPQIETWEQLANLCSQGKKSYEELDKVKSKSKDIEVTVMPFGKYKGELLVNVPRSYLDWMLKNMDNIQPNLKAAIDKLI